MCMQLKGEKIATKDKKNKDGSTFYNKLYDVNLKIHIVNEEMYGLNIMQQNA